MKGRKKLIVHKHVLYLDNYKIYNRTARSIKQAKSIRYMTNIQKMVAFLSGRQSAWRTMDRGL